MGTPAQEEALRKARAAKEVKTFEASQPKMYRVRFKGKKQGGLLLEFPLPFVAKSSKTGEVRLNPEGELTEEQFEQFQEALGGNELFEVVEKPNYPEGKGVIQE